MASRKRSTRQRARDSARSLAIEGASRSLSKSWFAIGTTLFGLIASYFGCNPDLNSYRNSQVSQHPAGVGPNQSTDSQFTSPWNTQVRVDSASGSNSGYQTTGNSWQFQPSGQPQAASHSVGQPAGQPNGQAYGQAFGQAYGQAYPQERDSILIGSFNIQTFGRTKMSRPEVVEILVDVVRRFDVLAVQELRDGQETTIPEFLRLINANGSRYVAEVSPRLSYGQGSHSEQLVFIYDSDQIELLSSAYVAQDQRRVMFRPPYVGHFRYKSRYPQTAFSFVLMNVHTSPQQTAAEFSALEEIFPRVTQSHPEDDFILLGDLNEEPGKYLAYRWLNNQYAAIPSHWKTNTAGTKNYDNFVFDFRRTAEFTGQSGVLNLKEYYQLSREQADLVSDHMPVWALFSSREAAPNNLVYQPATMR